MNNYTCLLYTSLLRHICYFRWRQVNQQNMDRDSSVSYTHLDVYKRQNVVINVTDENGQTLTGLTARFNKESKIINQASFFQFEAKDISKENELLTITDKDGEVFEFALYNIENQVNYHHLTLFRNTLKINFITSEGSCLLYTSRCV